MIELPSVTWITPTFNRVDLLSETIQSVLAQNYENLDYLVLDDGSTDETPDLLRDLVKRYPKRIRWVRHDNMGEARTINRGFELARGELVGKLSSDDLLDPQATVNVARAIAQDSKVVVAYPKYRFIDIEGRPTHEVDPIEFTTREALRLCDPTIGPGALVRRSAIAKAGEWDASFRYCGDMDFWLRLSLIGTFRRVPKVLSSFRIHDSSVSAGAGYGVPLARERVAVVDKFYDRHDLPVEVLEVRDAAYRSAYVAAGLCIGGDDVLRDRYLISDTHMPPRIRAVEPGSATAPEGLTGQALIDHQDHMIKWLHREVALRDAKVEELERERMVVDSLSVTRDDLTGGVLPDGDTRC